MEAFFKTPIDKMRKFGPLTENLIFKALRQELLGFDTDVVILELRQNLIFNLLYSQLMHKVRLGLLKVRDVVEKSLLLAECEAHILYCLGI